MVAGRWTLAAALLAFWAFCFLVTIAVGIRWARTGKTGSGLPVIGSIAAAAAILALPIGAWSQRLGACWVPLALEVVWALAFQTWVRVTGRPITPAPAEET
jgi:hypothetical protein